MKVSFNVLNYKTGQNYNTFVKKFNSENKIYAKNSNDFVVNSPVYNLNFLGNINALYGMELIHFIRLFRQMKSLFLRQKAQSTLYLLFGTVQTEIWNL